MAYLFILVESLHYLIIGLHMWWSNSSPVSFFIYFQFHIKFRTRLSYPVRFENPLGILIGFALMLSHFGGNCHTYYIKLSCSWTWYVCWLWVYISASVKGLKLSPKGLELFIRFNTSYFISGFYTVVFTKFSNLLILMLYLWSLSRRLPSSVSNRH